MSVHEKILQWLENGLFEGKFHLGQDLPDDRRIAAAIGSSNSSTREALKTLETMGIVRLYEGKRKTIITHLTSSPLASAGSALRLHMADARYPLRDTVEAQILLETWAVSRENPPQSAIENLESIVEAMSDENVFPQDFHALEVEFHIGLTKLSGNHMVTALMTTMYDTLLETKIDMLGRVPLWSAFATRARAEYQAILGAVKSGDRDLTAQLLVANITGQYEEADLNLDEETLLANALPGTQKPAVYFEPVEIDADDLIPEEWDETAYREETDEDDAVLVNEVHENTAVDEEDENPAEIDAVDDAEIQEETVEPVTETLDEEAAEAPKPEPVSFDLIEALQNVQPVNAPRSEVKPALDQTEQQDAEPEKDDFVRAPGNRQRRLRGSVTTPVHATVIQPRSAASAQAVVASGRLSAESEIPTRKAPAPKTASAGVRGQVEGDVVRAVPRAHTGKTLTGASAPKTAESVAEDAVESGPQKKSRGLWGRLFGFEENEHDQKTEEPSTDFLPEKSEEKTPVEPTVQPDKKEQKSGTQTEPTSEEETSTEPQKTRAQLRAEAKKAAAERKAAAKAEAKRRREEERAEIERLAAEQLAQQGPATDSENSSIPEGYEVYNGSRQETVYEDDVPETVLDEETDSAEVTSEADASHDEASQKESEKQSAPISGSGNALNKNKKKKKKKRR